MTALSLDSVSVRLGDVVALRDVSLVVNPGSHVAIVGASGSGKTTLLRAIVGLLKIGSGTISIDGQTVTGPATFTPTHRRGVGYVPQDGALFPHLSVERNIRFGLPSRVNRDRQVREATELVALEPELLGRFPHELSGGQQQRVALARALAVRPRIVVLDEPFSALDTALREHARHSVIDVLKRSGITTLLVTHDQHEALTFGDAVGVLDRGQLVQAGPPQALFNDPATPEIAAFLADACFIAGEIAGNNATTALGPVRIRHQHGELGGVSRIMLRPNQFAVDTSGASPNARVVGVSWRGSTTRMILRPLTGGDDPVTVELPTRETGAVAPDYLLAIRVVGTGVAYMSVPPVKQSPTTGSNGAAIAPNSRPTSTAHHPATLSTINCSSPSPECRPPMTNSLRQP